MKKVVTFGEIMLRLSTERHLRFSQANSFLATYGGSEFNVAVSLSNFKINTEFVTSIPNNELGMRTLEEIRKKNVGSHFIQKQGKRLGVYYLETGAASRGSSVLYDREDSSFTTLKTGTIDWDTIFKNASWFHWSGISPGASEAVANVCLEAVKAAKKRGVKVSCDLNYRSKLWSYGKEPAEIMPELLRYNDLVLGDIDTACLMTGIDKINPDYSNTKALPQVYNYFLKHFPNIEFMATTLRYSVNASHQKIGGIFYDKNKAYIASQREVIPVVDRVGSGDAFMGGLIYGLIAKPYNFQYAIDFAAAACCLKHSISGDYNLVSVSEVENLILGNEAALVAR
ncbi:sugar kinase, ribokinase [Galbibacter orientalis DSM 19592]|uniref:Sugar kinase, ribokinase n=1 Tax=Galbibacter orientalis DSM 19592 TaxID=926559 RepID=I3CAW1_9FLAO|nr:sugar kinase [Galbibacter orientalis]EIJ40754.1 sugar kinase, ribokinase [Galbibacter orientalis DSM 19592]